MTSLLLVLLFLLIMFYYFNIMSNNCKTKKTVTLLIRCECFREGGQNSRKSSESPECVENQLKCGASINQLILQPLEQLGFVCNVHLHTYKTKLVDVYLDSIANTQVTHHFEDKHKENQQTMWKKAIDHCIEKFDPDYIMVIRPDMMFYKEDFVYDIQLDKYNHAFRIGNHFCSNNRRTHLTPKGHTRISDTLQWIPRKHFDIANIFPGHEFYDTLPHMETESVYISDLYTDTDSEKCQNPLYVLPSRPLSDILPTDKIL